MRVPIWVPSQRFLILGGGDWVLIAAAYTLVQQGATGVHAMLFAVGILVIVVGLLRTQKGAGTAAS